jgi:hypothetical protein
MNAVTRIPSARRLQEAIARAQSFRAALIADDPSISDDDELLTGMLDAETDAIDFARQVIRYGLEAGALADAAGARAKALNERKARFERREEAARGTAAAILEALGWRKLEDAEFTASLAVGRPGVVIIDAAALPETCIRIKREPDKATIKSLLEAGQKVPGAELSNAAAVLTIRTK